MYIFALTDAFSVSTLSSVVSVQIKRYDALLEGSLRRHGSVQIKRYDALQEGSLRWHGSSILNSSLFTLFTLDSYFHLNLSPHLISFPFFSSDSLVFSLSRSVPGTRGRGRECQDGKRLGG